MAGKKNNTAAFLIIAFLLLLVIGTISFWLLDPFASDPDIIESSNMVAIPKVSTSVRSNDGSSHSLEANITLEFTDELLGSKANGVDINQKINDIISNLEFDRIVDEDGYSYIKDAIREGLSDYYTSDELQNIYFRDFAIDQFLENPSDSDSTSIEKYKGIMPNLE